MKHSFIPRIGVSRSRFPILTQRDRFRVFFSSSILISNTTVKLISEGIKFMSTPLSEEVCGGIIQHDVKSGKRVDVRTLTEARSVVTESCRFAPASQVNVQLCMFRVRRSVRSISVHFGGSCK